MNSDIKLKQKLDTAASFKAQGKHLHAIQLYEQLIREFPDDPNLYFELAELYELSGSLNSSMNLLETYLENNQFNAEAKFFYGQFLLKKQLWEKAIDVFSSFQPEDKPLSLFFLGYAYFMIKDYELARINFLSFLNNPVDRELEYQANIFLAKIEIELKDFERALEYAKQSELLFNSYWELYKIFAECYNNLGMNTHAVLSIEKAIKLNPKETELYEIAGRVYKYAGDYHKAEQYFVKYVESSDNINPITFAHLGETYIKLDKLHSAKNYFELALKIDPNNLSALNGLEQLSLKRKSSISKNV